MADTIQKHTCILSRLTSIFKHSTMAREPGWLPSTGRSTASGKIFWKVMEEMNIETQQGILVQAKVWASQLSVVWLTRFSQQVYSVLHQQISWNDCNGLSFQYFQCLEKVCWKHDNYVKSISIRNGKHIKTERKCSLTDIFPQVSWEDKIFWKVEEDFGRKRVTWYYKIFVYLYINQKHKWWN